jgi:hypothetical protein
MSTVDVNSVIVTGENSVIRLNKIDSDAFTTHASFWRILTSPAGPGDVLYLKSEVTEDRWRIYSDSIAMARWLQSTMAVGDFTTPIDRIGPEIRFAVDSPLEEAGFEPLVPLVEAGGLCRTEARNRCLF